MDMDDGINMAQRNTRVRWRMCHQECIWRNWCWRKWNMGRDVTCSPNIHMSRVSPTNKNYSTRPRMCIWRNLYRRDGRCNMTSTTKSLCFESNGSAPRHNTRINTWYVIGWKIDLGKVWHAIPNCASASGCMVSLTARIMWPILEVCIYVVSKLW